MRLQSEIWVRKMMHEYERRYAPPQPQQQPQAQEEGTHAPNNPNPAAPAPPSNLPG